MANLINDVKKLRELEQATREDTEISSPIDDSDYLERLVDVAPAMLEVLGMIREGDTDILYELLSDWVYSENHPAVEVLNRLQKATALMEKEEQ